MIRVAKPTWEPVTSSLLKRSILGPILFNIFISDLDGVEYNLSKFANNTELGGVSNTPEGSATIQRELSKLEKWANRNLTQLS